MKSFKINEDILQLLDIYRKLSNLQCSYLKHFNRINKSFVINALGDFVNNKCITVGYEIVTNDLIIRENDVYFLGDDDATKETM